MDQPLNVTIDSLRAELAAYYVALAVVADECFEPGAGNRMLGVAPDTLARDLDVIQVDRTRLGRKLPVWYRYAYEGVMSAGESPESLDRADSAFERLRDMLQLLSLEDPYFEDVMIYSPFEHRPQGHLADMVARASARANLDTGASLTLRDLSLLADMNERSVRNATSAEGDSRLVVDSNGFVSNEDARRWLQGRRGFRPTQRRAFPRAELPADLLDVEIPHFVLRRLAEVFRTDEAAVPAGQSWETRAAEAAGMSIERLIEVMRLPLSVRPTECAGLARAMNIDPVWFTLQVMTALFPQEVDMLMNPERWRDAQAEAPTALVSASKEAVAITLSSSMLRHGYIDIPVSARTLFPEDCFGTRKEGEEGAQVELRFGSHVAMTDIRQKSSQTLSPRKRFSAWLNSELNAKEGDRIRIERTGDRSYLLTHLPG